MTVCRKQLAGLTRARRPRIVWLAALLSAPFALPLAAQVEATTVPASAPAGVIYDSAGNLYVALRNDHVVRKIDTNGLITTVAGTGEQGFGGDGGAATSALLDSPAGLAIDSSGNLYIADTHNHRVREVVGGTIRTVAGNGVAGFGGDGASATAAQLDRPTAVTIDAAGNLYIADTDNQRIRKVSAGIISTVAGDGEQLFAGDAGAATAAALNLPGGIVADPTVAGRFYISDTGSARLRLVDTAGNISTVVGSGLARPLGLAVNSTGTVYIADKDNQRIASVSGTAAATAAGDGEQGFAGDTGAATAAVLDSPSAVAVSSALLAIADEHNGRARSFPVGGALNTVAGIAPVLAEGFLLSGPTSGTFGSITGQLTAVFSNNGKAASGTALLLDNGAQIGSASLSENTARFSLAGLQGGLQSLVVTFAGDTRNAPIASGAYVVNVSPAAQSVTLNALTSPVIYTPGLTASLSGTATSGLPLTYTVTGPATVNGSTLTFTGPGTVTVTANQLGSNNYLPASSASGTITVYARLAPTGVSPASVAIGSGDQVITVTGTGFTGTSQILVNNVALATTNTGGTLSAKVPAANFATLTTLSVSVTDSASNQTVPAGSIVVGAPLASATLSAPATAASGQQPAVTFQLQNAYPLPLLATVTLTFTPDSTVGVDDPAIQFSTGGRKLTFTIPANSTAVPAIALQTGSVVGTITLQLALTVTSANGTVTDVTPATARTAAIAIPRAVPGTTNVSFTQAGGTVTVTVRGFSNIRTMNQVKFDFTPAPGTKLDTTSLTLPAGTLFASWFTTAASATYGSTFTYTQNFQLSDATSVVQAVTVTLTNDVGSATPLSSP